MSAKKRLSPTHPGDILKEELQERGISLNKLARDTRIALSRISLIANGKRAVTAETALRFARYFGTSAQMWMNLQTAYDLEITARKAGKLIRREVFQADSNAAVPANLEL
jgi:addiction module HigA family antidote